MTPAGQGNPLRGPETVAGTAQLISEGFEPLENLTGAAWIGECWPDEHRRSVPETRAELMEDSDQSALWLVRSPWPTVTAEDALAIVWANLPRDDESNWRQTSADILRWPEHRAQQALENLAL